MKKLMLTAATIACITAVSFAQTPVPAPAAAPAHTEKTKEEKKAMKAKQEADLKEAYAAAGLSEEQIKSANAIAEETKNKYKALKGNDAITKEEKDAAKKTIYNEKSSKLKELMGSEKYKLYNGVIKKQKEAAKEEKGGE